MGSATMTFIRNPEESVEKTAEQIIKRAFGSTKRVWSLLGNGPGFKSGSAWLPWEFFRLKQECGLSRKQATQLVEKRIKEKLEADEDFASASFTLTWYGTVRFSNLPLGKSHPRYGKPRMT